MPVLEFSPSPEGTSEDTATIVRNAQFGDGYSQRVKDGINSTRRTWTVNFALPKASMNAIDAFLRARAGTEAFTWTPPYGGVGQWTCEGWRKAPAGNLEYTLSATFKEEFGA